MTPEESQLLQYYKTNYSLFCHPTPYFETYELFKLVINILTPISLILGFYGVFLILKVTPKEMASAKWVILNSHVLSFYLGSIATVLVRPFIFFPSTANYATGILLQLGVPFRVAIIFGQIAYPVDEISMIMLFENRYSQICKGSKMVMGSKLRFLFYFLHYTFFILLFIIHLSEPVDTVSAKLEILKTMPCPDPHFFTSDANVMTTKLTRQSKICTAQSVYLFSVAHLFSFCTGYCLLKEKSSFKISKKTRSLQKRFLFALIVQSVVPFLILFIPFCFYWTLMLTGIQFHFGGPLIVICIALHGIMSSALLILLHKPYRDYTVNIFFCKRKKLKKNEDVSRRVSVIPVSMS